VKAKNLYWFSIARATEGSKKDKLLAKSGKTQKGGLAKITTT